MTTRQTLIAGLQNLTGWVGGWVIMAKQAGIGFAPPEHVNDTMVWAAVLMAGGPGLWQVVLAILGRSPIGPSSSDSPGSASPSSSSGAPSSGAEA